MKYLEVTSPFTAVECAEWLQRNGLENEQSYVGFAAHGETMSFATTQAVVSITEPDEATATALKSMLKKVLLSREAPVLISRAVPHDVRVLSHFLSLTVDEGKTLAKKFVIDMGAASEVSGVPVKARDGNWAVALDALDAVVVGPQMTIDIPRYFGNVSMPLVYAQCDGTKLGEMPGLVTKLVYSNLFLRVLTHYSRDPVLIRLFRDTPDADPWKAISELLDLEPGPQTQSFMLWLTMGEDISFLNQYIPSAIPTLPDNPVLLKYERVDKKLPVTRLWVAETKEEFKRTRRAQTLYGRLFATPNVAELLHHTLIGSAKDLIEVAEVSLLNYGVENVLLSCTGPNYGFHDTITSWTTNDPATFEQEVTALARLGDPLIVPLHPKVVVG